MLALVNSAGFPITWKCALVFVCLLEHRVVNLAKYLHQNIGMESELSRGQFVRSVFLLRSSTSTHLKALKAYR